MKIECHCRQVSDSHTYKRTTQYIFVGEYNCVKVCMKVCECTCVLMNTCALIKRHVLVCRWIDILEEAGKGKRDLLIWNDQENGLRYDAKLCP